MRINPHDGPRNPRPRLPLDARERLAEALKDRAKVGQMMRTIGFDGYVKDKEH